MFPIMTLLSLTTPTGIVATLILILDVLAIIAVISGDGSAAHKLLWSLLIFLLPVVGLILYFLVGRSAADHALVP